MSKKTKTKSQSTQTTTPNNPTWVSKGLEDVGGSLGSGVRHGGAIPWDRRRAWR